MLCKVGGSEDAITPNAKAVDTLICTTDFSVSEPTITFPTPEKEESEFRASVFWWWLSYAEAELSPLDALSFAAALTWLLRGNVVGENILEASKGEPVAVLANLNHEEKNFSAADARSSFGIWEENTKNVSIFHTINRKQLQIFFISPNAPKFPWGVYEFPHQFNELKVMGACLNLK